MSKIKSTDMNITTPLVPATNGGTTLGSAALSWGNTYLNTGTKIDFGNGNVTLTHSTGALTLVGKFGIGGAPGAPLDIWDGSLTAKFGADNNAATRTDATIKAARIAVPHYLAAQPDVALIVATSTATDNTWWIGGGSNSYNALTTINFTVAANNTTTFGTVYMRLTAGVFRSNADGVTDLGLSGTAWGNLFLASGKKIDFGAGLATIQHVAGSGNLYTTGARFGIGAAPATDFSVANLAAGNLRFEVVTGGATTFQSFDRVASTYGVLTFDGSSIQLRPGGSAMAIISTTGLTIAGTLVVDANSLHRLRSYTVATLPAAGTAGRLAMVTDATAPTFLGTLTGGGAVRTPVFDNGTAWVAF